MPLVSWQQGVLWLTPCALQPTQCSYISVNTMCFAKYIHTQPTWCAFRPTWCAFRPTLCALQSTWCVYNQHGVFWSQHFVFCCQQGKIFSSLQFCDTNIFIWKYMEFHNYEVKYLKYTNILIRKYMKFHKHEVKYFKYTGFIW